MSAPGKKRHTDDDEVHVVVKRGSKKKEFMVKNSGGLVHLVNYIKGTLLDSAISSEEVFRHLNDKYTKPGALLQGYRLKAKLTQQGLANKLGPEVQQAHISAMEIGVRVISKKMARRLGEILKTDYKMFL